jgi:hypothetical protein
MNLYKDIDPPHLLCVTSLTKLFTSINKNKKIGKIGDHPPRINEKISPKKGNFFIFINNLCVIANDEIYCFFTNLYPKIISLSLHWGLTPKYHPHFHPHCIFNTNPFPSSIPKMNNSVQLVSK